MGRKFTAQEMEKCGMVARIFPRETFMDEVLKLATAAAKYPPQAMKDTKALIRDHDYDFLEKVSAREMTLLGVRMASDESAQAIMEFMSKCFFFVCTEIMKKKKGYTDPCVICNLIFLLL